MSNGFGHVPFGSGPYGSTGGVLVPAPHGVGSGYGGIPYGVGAYGATTPPPFAFPIMGGYGGTAYGLGSYGSLGMVAGTVTSVTSINGFQTEVFFSTAVAENTAFFNPASYVFTPVFGAAPTTAVSVAVGTTDAYGPTSAIVTHTGTTLGGRYDIEALGIKTWSGQPLIPPGSIASSVLTKGDPPSYTMTPPSGDTVEITFDEIMLTEAQFTPGIKDKTAYQFNSSYPVPLTINTITHPTGGDASVVTLDVQGMTSVSYNTVISPADAIIFDGTYLPSTATTFAGVEIGTGTSTIGAGRLLLTKTPTAGYGWQFIDTSGKVLPASSFRCEVTIDVPSASFVPPLFDTTLATFRISDGAVEALFTLKRIAGIDHIEVTSGAYFISSPTNWSTAGPYTFGLVRNQKADTFTILVDGAPIASALTGSFTGAATIPGGAEFILDPTGAYDVQLFPLQSVDFTSSQTVFSGAWNFLHGQGATFQGNDGITNDTLLVDCGPLVKGWGDATPATKQDVTVRVNGTPVEVSSVNPYLGVITTTIPIPLMPPGTMTVGVDYTWFPSPVFEFAGLNTLGVVLNKYDIHPGNNTVFSPAAMLPGGGSKEGERFQFGLVLAPQTPREPLYISHRFLGFEKAYTAALNSPTTLLLNRSNHTVALPDREIEAVGESVAYDGTTDPVEADPVWSLLGVNAQDENPDDIATSGIFPVDDALTGSYSTGQPTIYSREINTSLPSTVIVVPRFVVDRGNTEVPFQTDGVFTGVGFGAHNDDHLYLVGALLINDVQHIGMLTEPTRPEEVESWEIALATEITITSSTTFTMLQSDIPSIVREHVFCAEGSRIQILEGTQAGVYEIVEIVDNTDDTATVTVSDSTAFPNDPSLFGNAFFTGYFEIKWDGDGDLSSAITYRLVILNDIKDTPEGWAQLYVGGSLTGLVLTMEGGVPRLPKPADSVLLFPTSDRGQVFWGSLSRKATGRSLWSFVRYGVEDAATVHHFRGVVVAAEMNDKPEDDPNNIWFVSQEFGFSEIDSSADTLLLKSTSDNNQPGVNGIDLTFGYGRVEAFLDRTQALDLDATYRVESGLRGSGDAHIVVRDGEREVRLATLAYEETVTERRLIGTLPSISLSGLLLPERQVTDDGDGWVKAGSLTLESVQGQRIQYQQVAGETLSYAVKFTDYYPDPLPSKGRIMEMRLRVGSLTTADVSGNTGLYWTTDADDVGITRGVGITLRVPVGLNPARVVLFDVNSGADVATYDFDWQDGDLHTYRVLIDPDSDAVTVVLDDTVVGTVTFFANFTFTPTDGVAYGFGGSTTAATAELESFSVVVTPPATVKRTLGVWLGGDFADIDNWEIPRTDSLTVPNSDLSAVVEEMDWRSTIKVRIHRDPTWGVTILRPDLPPPPYFTGDFATQITEPSAGWINVEYRHLPQLDNPQLQDTLLTQLMSLTPPHIGFVAFGALDPASVTQQRWGEVRYRIYEYPSEDLIAPHHMVLNQYNVVSGGELGADVSVEEVTVTTVNATTISLRVTNITADRVFNLEYVDSEGEVVILTPDSFTFNRELQTITLNDGLTFRPLLIAPPDPNFDPNASINPEANDAGVVVDPASVHIPATVRSAPGEPVTTSYLTSQPLLEGITLLNEGTPPFTKSLVTGTEPVPTFGSKVNDPTDTLSTDPDFILNDPYRYVDFAMTLPEGMYENIDFLEVDNGGLTGRLSSFCDSQGKLAGLHELSLDGLAFTEVDKITFTDGTPGVAPAGGSAFQVPNQVMAWSGGSATTYGNLNQGAWGPPPPMLPPTGSGSLSGMVPMGVIGFLYDTLGGTTQVLYFGKQVPYP